MRRTALALVVVSISMFSVAVPVAADEHDPPPCLLDCRRSNPVAGPDGVESDVIDYGPGGDGGTPVPVGTSYLDDCTWNEAKAGVETYVHPSTGGLLTFDVDHWVVFCDTTFVAYTYFPIGDPPPIWVIEDMIRDAYQRTPVVAFNPLSSPAGDANIPLLYRALTYLWVDPAYWVPVSATASVPGFSVTTTATPVEAVWSGGDDPAQVTCGRGTPYQTGIGGDAAQDQSCTTVFEQFRPTQELRLGVRWDAGYTCTAVCTSGPLPPFVTNSARTVTVAEIQAIES